MDNLMDEPYQTINRLIKTISELQEVIKSLMQENARLAEVIEIQLNQIEELGGQV